MYSEYIRLRNNIIGKYFSKINPQQLEAVLRINGATLILAGAGSGKTTVMVNKIINILKYGTGLTKEQFEKLGAERIIEFLKHYNQESTCTDPEANEIIFCNIPRPWNVLAITFTNKAADEIKSRLAALLGEDMSKDINASTFHSACVKILRRNIDKLGYTNNFTIYDADDSKKIITEIIEKLKLDSKLFQTKSVLSKISNAKNELINPEVMFESPEMSNYQFAVIAHIYREYQKQLARCNALDFDDIIKMTVDLLASNDDVLEYYQNTFKYIMVDEYQDTNYAQFRLINLLSKKHNNICVVGDDDQSIYKFRGATIENILNFENCFEDTKVIRLEQNYRCTQTILDAANAVIAKNFTRKQKTLWTNNPCGEHICVYTSINEYGEAKFVIDTILNNISNGCKYSDNAVLYRTNFQSNIIEQYLVKAGIPYKILGGLRFYERKEIKDVIAYMSLINNLNDNVRLRRIINEPKRGIGDTTIKHVQEISDETGLSMFQILRDSMNYKQIAKKSNILSSFAEMIESLVEESKSVHITELVNRILQKTGYLKYLEMLEHEGMSRVDNITQLCLNIQKYSEMAEDPTLSGFLEEISLYADPDSVEKNDLSHVLLMTLHSAKGLEFKHVMIIGMDEGIFPGHQVIYNNKDLEEERRLAYVGFTRAKEKLYLINSRSRKLFNKTLSGQQSRFITEIPTDFCEMLKQEYPDNMRAADKYKENIARDKNNIINSRKTIGIGITQMAMPKRDRPIENLSARFVKGSSVKHKIFGKGIILSATKMANDVLLEIDFDKVGSKKIMANFAGVILCD